MASLGNIRWSVGYTSTADSKSSTKTFSGLNLDQSGGAEADAKNAATASLLVSLLTAFSTNTVTAVTLTEARGVDSWQIRLS